MTTTNTIKTDIQILDEWKDTALDGMVSRYERDRLVWRWIGHKLYLLADPKDAGLGLLRLCRDLAREIKALPIEQYNLDVHWGDADPDFDPSPILWVSILEVS